MSAARVFLDHLSDDLRGGFAALADLDDRLRQLSERARGAWPGLSLEDAVFFRYLAARMAPGAQPTQALEAVHAEDLFLACAVVQGDARALEAARERCLAKMHAALFSAGLADVAEETTQQVLAELLLPDSAGRRGIEAYRGTGELAAFAKVLALRTARHGIKRRTRERSLHAEAMLERATAQLDPELEALKLKYRQEFKAAFYTALTSLDDRERNVLRYELVGGLNIDQIGKLYGVHRATVARWRGAARERLFTETERALRTALGIGETEFHSIVRLIHSEFQVSLTSYLAADEA